MVVNTFCIYELWIFLGRKRVSVVVRMEPYRLRLCMYIQYTDIVVANTSIQTACMYVYVIHGDLHTLAGTIDIR